MNWIYSIYTENIIVSSAVLINMGMGGCRCTKVCHFDTVCLNIPKKCVILTHFSIEVCHFDTVLGGIYHPFYPIFSILGVKLYLLLYYARIYCLLYI